MKLTGGEWSKGDAIALIAAIVPLITAFVPLFVKHPPGPPPVSVVVDIPVNPSAADKVQPNSNANNPTTNARAQLTQPGDKHKVAGADPSAAAHSVEMFNATVIHSREIRDDEFILDGQPATVFIVSGTLNSTVFHLPVGIHKLSLTLAGSTCAKSFSVPSDEPIPFVCNVSDGGRF